MGLRSITTDKMHKTCHQMSDGFELKRFQANVATIQLRYEIANWQPNDPTLHAINLNAIPPGASSCKLRTFELKAGGPTDCTKTEPERAEVCFIEDRPQFRWNLSLATAHQSTELPNK